MIFIPIRRPIVLILTMLLYFPITYFISMNCAAADIAAAGQEGGQSAVDAGAYSHRFLEALPQERGPGGDGLGGGSGGDRGGSEEATKVEVFPQETPEQKKERESIRSVLRLLDGDVVEIDREVHVRLVGVHVPEFKNAKDRVHFERFAKGAKEWLEAFVENPQDAVQKYDGLKSGINYRDKNGGGFVFYYLYVPDALLEDIRKEELKRYDDWVHNKKGELPKSESSTDRADAAMADLKQKMLTAGPDAPKDVKEYVISEAKYYYDDGSLKREEIFRDGKLMIRRVFSQSGQMLDETVFDDRVQAVGGLSRGNAVTQNKSKG